MGNDVLMAQKADLKREYEQQAFEEVEKLSNSHMESLATLSGTITGINTALDERETSDTASLASQRLWLACNSLKTAVETGNVDASSWEEKLRPLSDLFSGVQQAAVDDTFLSTILASISPVALNRGVYTEDRLKERFSKVEKVAKKVAGIGENGGSLLAFGLCYLQSLLVVDTTSMGSLDSLDLSTTSPVELVMIARHSLDRGNLGKAVQVLGQLTGEPARVASDWLAEARLTLETKQAVETMLIYSQASSCSSLPQI